MKLAGKPLKMRLPDGREVEKWTLKMTGEDQGDAWFGFSTNDSSI